MKITITTLIAALIAILWLLLSGGFSTADNQRGELDREAEQYRNRIQHAANLLSE